MPSSRGGPVAVAGEHVPLTLLFVLLAAGLAGAQPSSTPPVNYNYLGGTKFTPAMAVLLVALIAAFFFLGFFSIYIRHCGRSDVGGSNIGGGLAAVMARSRRQRGLDAAVIESFPKMRYAEAKELMVGKETLECAVCLSEFEDDEELRMLPKCSHVFHPDCIDAWLEAHVTCPVCRCNLDSDPASADDAVPVPDSGAAAPREEESTGDETAAPVQEVAINVHESNEEEESRKEAMELERIGSQRRAIRSRSGRQPAGFARSHSTGHSLAVPLDRNLERFTLRLPEHVRKDIIAAGEASLRRGRRAGDGSSRGGARSVRLGRSDRWPPFVRTFSARVPFWGASSSAAAASRREGEGSTTRGRRAASARVGVAGEEPVEGAPVAAIARQV